MCQERDQGYDKTRGGLSSGWREAEKVSGQGHRGQRPKKGGAY